MMTHQVLSHGSKAELHIGFQSSSSSVPPGSMLHYTGLDWPTVHHQKVDIISSSTLKTNYNDITTGSSSTHMTSYYLTLHAYTCNAGRLHITRRFPDRRSVPPGLAY